MSTLENGVLEAAVKITRGSPVADADYYDCVAHVSGSRQSIFHLYLLTKVAGLRVLALTFNHLGHGTEGLNRIGRAIEVFNVDHVMFNARESVLNRVREGSLRQAADAYAQACRCGAAWMSVFFAREYATAGLFLDPELGIATAGSAEIPAANLPAVLAKSLPTAWMADRGFDQLDLKPYTFSSVALLPDQKVFSLLESLPGLLSEHEANFALEFAWEDERDSEADKIFPSSRPWHERTGRRETTLDKDRRGREPTRYEALAQSSEPEKALYHDKLRYCVRCCMPETAESFAFDEMGMCQPCRSSEQKMHIDWREREGKLRSLVNQMRSPDGSNYDLIIPISGGKDSTFQVYILTKKFNLRPLAVTFSHNWYTHVGRQNLINAYRRFDVDHVMLTPRRSVINKVARKSLYNIGDSCWHCHAGIGAFPLQAAAKFGVKLLVWGESVAERDGRATYDTPILFDRDYFTKISARVYAEQLVGPDLSLYEVQPYILPSHDEMETKQVQGVHLGNYMFWDDERQTEFVRDHWGWLEDDVEGAYKGFKSVECRMAGVHDYSKFIKRGFGRGTDQASLDVRAGLMTREEAFDLAKHYDAERPDALDYYLEITGFSEEEFEKILKAKREGKAKNLP